MKSVPKKEAWVKKQRDCRPRDTQAHGNIAAATPSEPNVDNVFVIRTRPRSPYQRRDSNPGPSTLIQVTPARRFPSDSSSESSLEEFEMVEMGPSQNNHDSGESAANPSAGALANGASGTVIEIENEPNVLPAEEDTLPSAAFWNQIFLVIILRILYNLCMIPYDVERKVQQKADGVLQYIRKVFYAMVVSLGLAYFMADLVYVGLNKDHEHHKIDYFVTMFHFAINGFLPLAVGISVSVKAKTFIRMLQDLIEAHVVRYDSWKICLTSLMMLSSFGTAMCASITFALDLGPTSIQDLITSQSFEFALSLYPWSTKSIRDAVYDEYGVAVNSKTTTMAVIGTCTKFLSYFLLYLIRDVGLALAVTLCWECNKISYMMSASKEIHAGSQQRKELNGKIWTEFKRVRLISEDMDSIFWFFLLLLHINYLNYCAYFLLDIIALEFSYNTIVQVITFGKLISFYIFAVKGSLVNLDLRKWAKSTYTADETVYVEDGVHVKLIIALDNLSHNPIVLGSSILAITTELLAKIASLVGAFFLLFLEEGARN